VNRLSWLLYWADVLPKVSTWLCILSFLLFVGFAFIFFCGISKIEDSAKIDERWSGTEQKYLKVEKEDTSVYRLGLSLRRLGYFSPLFFILWGASFLVPSKDTFYLIAGSEAGEQVLKTPEMTKIRAVINGYLDDQLPKDQGQKYRDDKGGEK